MSFQLRNEPEDETLASNALSHGDLQLESTCILNKAILEN